MEHFTKSELRKLASLCAISYRECKDRLDGAEKDHTSDLEKELLALHIDYMAHLLSKLDRIANSDAKRVEIRNG
jgi:hypothetical protein